jgi:probable DNA repair protein
MLQAFRWPGKTPLTSDENEIVEAWKDAVSELATLSALSSPVSLDEALDTLHRALRTHFVASAGTLRSPVQILDSKDAAGLICDVAVLTGLGEESWPPPVRISPLIPMRLQERHGVPGAGAQGIRREVARLSNGLLSAARSSTGTFQNMTAPVLRPYLVETQQTGDMWKGPLPVNSFAPSAEPHIRDAIAPPLVTGSHRVPGGNGILKAQSQCPFQAFAKYRLGARELKDAGFGYDALDRGNFVHNALQKIWERLGSGDALRSLSDEDLEGLVRSCVADVFAVTNARDPLSVALIRAEQERISSLVLKWMTEIERARDPNFHVEKTEAEFHCTIAGLELSLRLDRVDRLADGSLLLIDYKTGAVVEEKNLTCPRPKEPQLLLYATALRDSERIAGIYFGKINEDRVALVGLGPIAKAKRAWDTARAVESTAEIERLAADFVAGAAAVDPLPKSCDICHLKALCRFNETSGSTGEELE